MLHWPIAPSSRRIGVRGRERSGEPRFPVGEAARTALVWQFLRRQLELAPQKSHHVLSRGGGRLAPKCFHHRLRRGVPEIEDEQIIPETIVAKLLIAVVRRVA